MKYDRIKSAFPKFWYVVADEKNYEKLEEIRKELFQPDEPENAYFESGRIYLQPGKSLISEHEYDDSYYYNSDLKDSCNSYYDMYTRLTFEELVTILESIGIYTAKSNTNPLFNSYYDII